MRDYSVYIYLHICKMPGSHVNIHLTPRAKPKPLLLHSAVYLVLLLNNITACTMALIGAWA